MTEWKQVRPEWCPHAECEYRASSQAIICVGHLPTPAPQGDDENTDRICLQTDTDGEPFDLQINASDVFHLRRMFDVIFPQEGTR